jgi:hypothetical protein
VGDRADEFAESTAEMLFALEPEEEVFAETREAIGEDPVLSGMIGTEPDVGVGGDGQPAETRS